MPALLVPPRTFLSWTASALTTNFGGYNLYRRPTRAAPEPWEKIGAITVPAGWTRATVEAQHRFFIDYEAGWAVTGGQWASGWDYGVSSINFATQVESTITPTVTAQTVTAADTSWVTCNAFPFLSFPAQSLGPMRDTLSNKTTVFEIAGRDRYAMRRRPELPGRDAKGQMILQGLFGPDQARHVRLANQSDKRMSLLKPTGDKLSGFVVLEDWEDLDRGRVAVNLRMVESAPSSTPADYNWPCGIIFDGSTDYISVADNASLDPASSAFTVVMCGVFADSAGTQYALSKGNIGSAAGYAIRSTGSANQIAGVITGATTTATTTSTSATWFDGFPHVAVLTSSGAAQVLYRDGASDATSATTHGAVANAIALIMGGNNAGATNGMALAPGIAMAYYNRQLTATEAQAASYYLLGYPGYRMPYNPACYIDLRDDRTWNGQGTVVTDLSGNANHGTIVSAPATRGIPWPLKNLEKV